MLEIQHVVYLIRGIDIEWIEYFIALAYFATES